MNAGDELDLTTGAMGTAALLSLGAKLGGPDGIAQKIAAIHDHEDTPVGTKLKIELKVLDALLKHEREQTNTGVPPNLNKFLAMMAHVMIEGTDQQRLAVANQLLSVTVDPKGAAA